MKKLILLLSLLLALLCWKASATAYYLSPTGGSTGNTGLSVAQAWPFEWALTNQNGTFNGGDVLYVLPGTYTGKSSDIVGGGTNQIYIRCAFNTQYPTNWVTMMPFSYGRFILDARMVRIQQPGLKFKDIEFTDSTKASSPSTRANQPTLDTAGSSYGLAVENCIATYTGHWPGSAAYVIGNDCMYNGAEWHEHGVYAQLTNIDRTNGAPYRPIIMGNVWHTQAGEPIKLIDGAIGVLIASNITINPGLSSPVNGQQGFTYSLLHQPSPTITNAMGAQILRNYFLYNTNVTQPVSQSCVELYNGATDGYGLEYIYNYMLAPLEGANGINQLVFGTVSGNGRDLYYLNVKSNTFVHSGASPFVRTRSTPWPAGAQMDYNTYINNQASASGAWFQWNNSGIYRSASAWTNATSIGGSPLVDVNSTFTWSDSTLGGDKIEVFPDPLTTGRGHLLCVNNSGNSIQNFDLTPLGLRLNQNYTLMYSQALTDQSHWYTGTWNGASLAMFMSTNGWPKQPENQPAGLTQTIAVTNSLPQIGCWLVYPAPIAPTLTAKPTAGRASWSLSWGGGSRWHGVRIYRSVNGGATNELTTVSMVTGNTYTDSAVTPTSKYVYVISAYNAYAESPKFSSGAAGDGIGTRSTLDAIFHYFFRFLPLPRS